MIKNEELAMKALEAMERIKIAPRGQKWTKERVIEISNFVRKEDNMTVACTFLGVKLPVLCNLETKFGLRPLKSRNKQPAEHNLPKREENVQTIKHQSTFKPVAQSPFKPKEKAHRVDFPSGASFSTDFEATAIGVIDHFERRNSVTR